ncbi:MAG: protein-export rane protein SecF [Cyanobacteriota bacterium]
MLTALLALGGATLQQFVAMLVVGFASGMYSSIFNAAPIVVAWDEKSLFHKEKQAERTSPRVVAA